MAIADELDKLRQLHDSGDLSDEEFAKAKDAALRSAEAEPASGDVGQNPLEKMMFGGDQRSLGEAANRYVSLQIVMAIVGLIVFVVFALIILSTWGHFPGM